MREPLGFSLMGYLLRAYCVPGHSRCWEHSFENRKETSGPVSCPVGREMYSPLCQWGCTMWA